MYTNNPAGYLAPEIEVNYVEVEQGIASSIVSTTNGVEIERADYEDNVW